MVSSEWRIYFLLARVFYQPVVFGLGNHSGGGESSSNPVLYSVDKPIGLFVCKIGGARKK